MIIISLLLARCLLGTWGDNLYPSSHSVFSIAQWNRNYQSHFTDGATGLWGQETYEVYAINGGGGQKNTEIHKVWGLSAPPPPKPTSQQSHVVTWVMTQDLWPQWGVPPLLPWHLPTPLVWSLTSSQGSALPVCPVAQLTTSPAESENYTVPVLEVAEFFGNVIPFFFPRDN